jgi:hypothetical protein
MLTLEQLPPPSGYGPGRWAYVDWNPAPVFIPDKQRPSVASRAGTLPLRGGKAVIGGWVLLKARVLLDWLLGKLFE